MFKKFKYNLRNTHVGTIWSLTFILLLCVIFGSLLPGETIIPKNQLAIMLLSLSAILNLIISTYNLIKGDIQPINVTYVCSTARKYMNEQEIAEIEKVEE